MSSKELIRHFVRDVNDIIKENNILKQFIERELFDNRPNFWEIIEYGSTKDKNGRSAHETRYSRMIRWLLDPTENHRLSHLFARELLKKLDSNILNDYLLENFSDEIQDIIDCRTEKEKIDIYYYNETKSIQIAIELKQYSTEHNSGTESHSQLEEYSKILDKIDGECFKVFLTPYGDEPSEGNADWKPLSYQDLINILDKMLICSYDLDFIKIVTDFKYDLQRTTYNLDYDNSKQEVRELATKYGDKIKCFEQELENSSDGLLFKKVILEEGLDESVIMKAIEILRNHVYKQDHTKKSQETVELIERLFKYYTGNKVSQSDDYIPIVRNEIVNFKLVKKSKKGQNLTFISSSFTDSRKNILYIAGNGNGDFPAVLSKYDYQSEKSFSVRKDFKVKGNKAGEFLDNDKFEQLVIELNRLLNS